MPTLLRFDGLRVVIYPNDHRPMHVHVIGAGSEAVFDLETADGQPALRENYGFSATDIRRVRSHLAKRLEFLIEGWRSIHGASK
jgi:hypothetical protein